METIQKYCQPKILLALLIFATTALLSWNTFQTLGPHGGTVKKADNYYIEMNNADKHFNAYLLDKKLKTINDKNIICESEFFFPDSTMLNVRLKPSLDGGFNGEITPGFYACKITFNVSGKFVSETFESTTQIVQHK